MTETIFGKNLVWLMSHPLTWRRRDLRPILQPATRGTIKMFWLHFGGAVRLSIFIYSLWLWTVQFSDNSWAKPTSSAVIYHEKYELWMLEQCGEDYWQIKHVFLRSADLQGNKRMATRNRNKQTCRSGRLQKHDRKRSAWNVALLLNLTVLNYFPLQRGSVCSIHRTEASVAW